MRGSLADNGGFIRLSALLVTVFLSGCATLDENQCRNVDWYEVGQRDGRNGHLAERLGKHAEACAEFGIGVGRDAYLDGRNMGLSDYCQLDNAMETGLAGRKYRGVCPSVIDAKFRRVNSAAYKVHTHEKRLLQIDNRLRQYDHRLHKIRHRDAPKYVSERRELRARIRKLERERSEVRSRLSRAERSLDRAMNRGR